MNEKRRSISEVTFYKLCLLLPFLVPVLSWGLLELTAFSGFGVVALFTGVGLMYAGIPYVLMCAVALYRHWKAPASIWRREAGLFPLKVLAVFLVGGGVFLLAFGEIGSAFGEAGVVLSLSAFFLVIGYAYVGLVFLLRWICIGFGVVERDERVAVSVDSSE